MLSDWGPAFVRASVFLNLLCNVPFDLWPLTGTQEGKTEPKEDSNQTSEWGGGGGEQTHTVLGDDEFTVRC